MKRGARSMGPATACILRRLLLSLVLLTGCHPKGDEPAVATVNGAAIPQSDAAIELRAVLWRRGESWAALDEATRKSRRQEAVDRSVEQRLLKNFAPQPAPLPYATAKMSDDEFQQFLKQFEPPDGWKPRFDLQGAGEMKVRQRITDEVVQGDAIEAWLKSQKTAGAAEEESAARSWFEQHRESLRVPERAKVSHLFLTAHDQENPDRSAEIADLHRQLLAGEATLESLAAKSSDDERSKKAGGSLGWISRDRVPADFAAQVFALPLGKPSAPFRTKLGWHIVIVHERLPARLPEFPEVKDEILARLDQSWRDAAVKRLLKELREKAKVEVNEAGLQKVEPAPQ